MTLTPHLICAFVALWIERRQYAPALSDIARGVDCAPARVSDMAHEGRRLRLLSWTPGLGRTLFLTPAGRACADEELESNGARRIKRAVSQAAKKHRARRWSSAA